MTARHDTSSHTLDAGFQYPIYSPRGSIEGALLQVGDEPVQLVLDPHDEPAAAAFAQMATGAAVSVEVHGEGPSDKGPSAHRVLRLERLVSVAGRSLGKAAAEPRFEGTVVRLNFARHGEANGVVLDSGHFIHTKPGGMAALKLAVGDRVEAQGESKPLVTGGGRVVEATRVNGKPVGKPRH